LDRSLGGCCGGRELKTRVHGDTTTAKKQFLQVVHMVQICYFTTETKTNMCLGQPMVAHGSATSYWITVVGSNVNREFRAAILKVN
jgi:hypothetical protein